MYSIEFEIFLSVVARILICSTRSMVLQVREIVASILNIFSPAMNHLDWRVYLTFRLPPCDSFLFVFVLHGKVLLHFRSFQFYLLK